MAKSKKENFSKHISWKEAFGSATAKKLKIKNIPNENQLANMKTLAAELFEPLREKVGEPIIVNSFFRSEELNNAISGAVATSQHIDGCAIDLDATGVTNCELFYIIKNELDYDKLIWELGLLQVLNILILVHGDLILVMDIFKQQQFLQILVMVILLLEV